MNVGAIRLRDGRSMRASPPVGGPVVRASPSAGGPTARASPWTEGPTWLRTGWSRAVFTVGASAVVGVAAGLGPKYAVAALFGVALVVIVLARPVIGAYTLVAVAPPVSGLRAGLPAPQFRLSEVLIASVGVLLLLIARPGQTPRWRAFDWLALGYAVANAVLGAGDLLARGSPISISDADKLLGPMQFFLLYRAVLATLTTQRQRQAALRLLLFASVPVSLLAILQEIHAPGFVNLLANITDSQAFSTNVGVARATGPFALWHDLGSYLFVIVMLGVALLINQSWQVIKPRTLAAIVVLAGIALVCTVSLTPIAGTAVGVLVLAVTARPRKQWVARIAGLIVLLGAAFEPILANRFHEQFALQAPIKQIPYLPQNLNFRITVWTTEFFPVIAKHLTTGYGPDFPPGLAFSYTESIYVTILLRGGLLLLFLYAGLMLALALQARDLRKHPEVERRAIAQVLLVVIVLVVFMQMTTNYFVNAGFPFLFWVLAALLMSGTGNRGRRHWTPPSYFVPRQHRWRPPRPPPGLPHSQVERFLGTDPAGREPPAASPPPESTQPGATEEHGHLRGVGTVLRGFAVLSAATVLIRLIGFVAVTLFARKAGPQTFGTYAFAVALAGFVVGAPTNFGIGTLGTRKIARDPSSAGKVVGEALAVQAIIAAFAVALLVALVPLLSSNAELVAVTPLVALYYVAYSMTVDWALQGLQRLRAVAVARLAGQVLFGIVTPLVLVSGSAGAVRYAAVFAAGAILTAIVAFAMVRRAVGPIRVSWSIVPLWDLAKRAAPLGFSLVMLQIYWSMDQVLLGLLTDKEQVGQYAAAAKLPVVLSGFIQIWVSAVYPHASKLFTHDRDVLRRQLGSFTSLSIVVALPLAAGSAILDTPIITGLFGPAYSQAGPTFAILMAASAIVVVAINFTSLAMAVDQERTFALSVTIASVANVLLNLLLIPLYGPVGAAISTVVAESVVFIICAHRVIARIGRPPLAARRIAGAVVATAVMSGALLAMPSSTSVWLRIAAGGAVFLVVAAACGAVRREDLALLRHGV
jgi:O-antigen/teichoic acid export membrane protein